MERILRTVDCRPVPLTEVPFPSRPGVELLSPPSTPEELEQLAAVVSQYEPTLCVIATTQLGLALTAGLKFEKSWAFDSRLPQVIHVANKVLYVIGSPVLKHSTEHQQLIYPYFLVNLLGIKRALILDTLSTASPEYPVGSWVRVSDHIGISYFNPLFGHNIEKWGVRFPDISESYQFDWDWSKELTAQGAVCKEGVALFTNPSRFLHSKSLVSVAEFGGAGVIAKNSVNAVIALGHRKIDEPIKAILSIGYVCHDPVREMKVPPPGADQIQALHQLIARFNH